MCCIDICNEGNYIFIWYHKMEDSKTLMYSSIFFSIKFFFFVKYIFVWILESSNLKFQKMVLTGTFPRILFHINRYFIRYILNVTLQKVTVLPFWASLEFCYVRKQLQRRRGASQLTILLGATWETRTKRSNWNVMMPFCFKCDI